MKSTSRTTCVEAFDPDGPGIRQWLDAWAEFEALGALALYPRENPEDCWPAIDCATAFHAEALGHPLLPRAVCVSAPRKDSTSSADLTLRA